MSVNTLNIIIYCFSLSCSRWLKTTTWGVKCLHLERCSPHPASSQTPLEWYLGIYSRGTVEKWVRNVSVWGLCRTGSYSYWWMECSGKPRCGHKLLGESTRLSTRSVAWLGPDGRVFSSEFWLTPGACVINADCTKHPRKDQHCAGDCHSQRPDLRFPKSSLQLSCWISSLDYMLMPFHRTLVKWKYIAVVHACADDLLCAKQSAGPWSRSDEQGTVSLLN